MIMLQLIYGVHTVVKVVQHVKIRLISVEKIYESMITVVFDRIKSYDLYDHFIV